MKERQYNQNIHFLKEADRRVKISLAQILESYKEHVIFYLEDRFFHLLDYFHEILDTSQQKHLGVSGGAQSRQHPKEKRYLLES